METCFNVENKADFFTLSEERKVATIMEGKAFDACWVRANRLLLVPAYLEGHQPGDSGHGWINDLTWDKEVSSIPKNTNLDSCTCQIYPQHYA